MNASDWSTGLVWWDLFDKWVADLDLLTLILLINYNLRLLHNNRVCGAHILTL